MKKMLLTGVIVLAGAVFMFQGISVAEETGIVADTEAVVAETQSTANAAVLSADVKKDEEKKEAEETVAVALQGDAVPVPVIDTKK